MSEPPVPRVPTEQMSSEQLEEYMAELQAYTRAKRQEEAEAARRREEERQRREEEEKMRREEEERVRREQEERERREREEAARREREEVTRQEAEKAKRVAEAEQRGRSERSADPEDDDMGGIETDEATREGRRMIKGKSRDEGAQRKKKRVSDSGPVPKRPDIGEPGSSSGGRAGSP